MRADADRDGRISRPEWIAFKAAHPGKGGDPGKQFDKVDTNHDGYITPDEIDAVAARMFARRAAAQSPAPVGGENQGD